MNRRWLITATLVVSLLTVGCRLNHEVIGANGSPIILISIDTLRSDHLPAYGYTKIDTPAIDAFRSDSILYQRVYSPCPLTLVSHATMFTGMLPAEHGIRDNIGYELNPKAKTVAEILKARGYATGAAVSAIVLRGDTGIQRGFDFYDDDIDIDPNFISLGRAQRKGDETRQIAQRWIAEHQSKPFFFFFHIYEPHTPYEPTYDADVVSADAIVGRFLDFLREQRIYDRATIILLSDHGEGLGDHGESEHGIFLYRETLQVPLMLKLPKSRKHGESVEKPVALLDVFSTITGQKSAGTSLIAALNGDTKSDRPIYSETYYPRFHFGWSDLHSMISGPNHYIQAPKPELYDLAKDSAEKANVLESNRRTYLALRNAIAPYVKGAEAPKAIDPERAKQLAALGYVGSTVSTSNQVELPDPKDHIAKSGRMKDGFTAFHEKRYEDAVKIFGELLRENQNMLDIWSMQAHSLAKLGRYDEAIDAAKKGLRISPTATQLAILIANLALEEKRFDEAEKHAHLIEKDTPLEAHSILAELYLLKKDYARSTAEANAVLGGKREKPFGLMLLGRIAMEQGNLDEAVRDFDEALAVNEAKKRQAIPKLNFFRGDALARMGKAEEAEEAFRREIAEYPTDPQPYKNLILLYVAEGKNDAATQLIFALEKAAPIPPSYVAISETLKIVGDRNGSRFWAARGLNKFPADRHLQALLRG
jgi:tetratricopeptide (TPR) repeat protein